MEALFKEVQVDKITDKIVDQLEDLIKQGRLVPGNKLPSERQLIQMLGVGRSSLREALNKLETMGFVEIKKRRGIFVKSIDSTFRLEPMKRMMEENKNRIVQLYEIRGDLEQASAFAAAENRNEQDLAEIRQCLEKFESETRQIEFKWELDQAFHCAVARASHNFFRIHVVNSIFDFSKEFIKPIIERFAGFKENSAAIAGHHNAIFKAIKEKNREEAGRIMKEHLDWTNQRLVEHFQSIVDTSTTPIITPDSTERVGLNRNPVIS